MGRPSAPQAAVAQASTRNKLSASQPQAARQQATGGKTFNRPAPAAPAPEPVAPPSLPPVDQPSEPAVAQPAKPTAEELFAAKPKFSYQSRKVGPSGAISQARSRKTR